MRAGLAACVALATSALAPAGAEQPASAPGSSFEGTWSASGRRESVAVEGGAVAAIVEVNPVSPEMLDRIKR